MPRPRTLLLTAATTAALCALPVAAHAGPFQTEMLDRATYDSAPELTEGSLRVAGPTRGELGGYLDATVTARDGSLPVGSQVCESAFVDGVLTVSPGETLTIQGVRSELCTSFYGDSMSMSAGVRSRNIDYEGTAHRRARIVGEGLISVGAITWFGGQASFSATVRW
jgi:hypothetical protein